MTRILVTGAYGQLGSELRNISNKHNQFDWVFCGKSDLDITDFKKLEDKIIEINPSFLINCAAYTSVDKAESEFVLSDLLNHQSVANLAKFSVIFNFNFIHISTDYVFNGNSHVPILEKSNTNPINMYGTTKLMGELACIKENPNSIIIRTSWLYSIYGDNFVKTISRLMLDRNTLNIVNDQVGSPTYAADLAEAIILIINHEKWIPGIYNFSNTGKISWYQFALSIKKIGKFTCDLIGVPSNKYPTEAKRPAFSLLDTNKIKNTFGIVPSNYLNSLKKCMSLIT